MTDKSLFEQLQGILLQEDRKQAKDFKQGMDNIRSEVTDLKDEVDVIKDDVNSLKADMHDPDKFGSKVDPMLDNKITELKNNFQYYFGDEVKETIKTELDESRDEFIEALYPIIGQIASKYVKFQFETFLATVSGQLDNAFSPRKWGRRVKALFAGVSTEELLIRDAAVSNVKIEEVFVIHLDSGLLIGSYSSTNTADLDMIAGMLTAIKSFVRDAFQKEGQGELETIEYGNYKIVINNFHKYYIATVLTGNLDPTFKLNLDSHLNTFARNHVPDSVKEVNNQIFDRVSKKLKINIQEFEHTLS